MNNPAEHAITCISCHGVLLSDNSRWESDRTEMDVGDSLCEQCKGPSTRDLPSLYAILPTAYPRSPTANHMANTYPLGGALGLRRPEGSRLICPTSCWSHCFERWEPSPGHKSDGRPAGNGGSTCCCGSRFLGLIQRRLRSLLRLQRVGKRANVCGGVVLGVNSRGVFDKLGFAGGREVALGAGGR